uniref:BAI1 associated protein 3 n=1 Tax=Takifugu rubripes TaxID=31033 RepID=A0A674N624_TAKRU
GVPSAEHVKSDEELFAYLLKVLPVCLPACLVSVVKAKNLMAKDANGYSDPYCMLGILMGQSPREMEEKKERKFSFRKRKEKLEKRSSTKEVLPARSIQVTEVKPETLNPVWDEHFLFEIDDVNNDLLHLDIWDHDDDVSVAEACKKLNEVSGLRGMGRYFKQIAKSVRANGSASSGSEENADDFLGCINIPLNEMPVVGYDTWFKLEPRSSTSKVQGECHLILKLFTNQVCERRRGTPRGRFRVGHRLFFVCVCSRWQCYSSHHRTQRVCYSLLLRLLRSIDAEWDPALTEGPSCVQERQLSDSFRLYTEHCLCLMKNMRQVFPCASAAAITRFELMLRGIGYMQNMRAFKSVCPLRNELHLDITTAVKVTAKQRTSEFLRSSNPNLQCGTSVAPQWRQESLLKRLEIHIATIYMDCFPDVPPDCLFEMSGGGGELSAFFLGSAFMEKRRFSSLLPDRDAKMLALTGFHNWFKSPIHKWLQIVHDRSCDRISKAVEMDKLEPVGQEKHSSSAVEVIACFGQVRKIWLQLAWPDSAGAFIFITRLTDVSGTASVRTFAAGRDWISSVSLCIALNSMEHVRVFLAHLPRDLDWQGVERAMEESCGLEGKEQVYKALNGQLYNMDLDLQREAKHLITMLTEKMLPELRRYIQHISLSPDSINNDEAVSPLMKYLQDTMVILTENLMKENLTRVLQSMWELLLRMILDALTENRGVQVEFYNRFQYTVETLLQFFHAKGEGLSLEDMKSGDYKVLDEELRLNKCSSFELIEQYYLEKISHQKTLKHTRYGRISVKCYYDAPEQRLTVEILHAADIMALDANGLSDPFVIVELCPHHLFPMAKSQRTQVKLKTLHPVFDELFYFHVSPEQYRHRFACLTFTVMDYDWLSTNDFAGEAVAPLSDFCWPGRPNASPAGKSVQPAILHLSRSKPSGAYVQLKALMLDARVGDREAQEFVRRLKEIEKSMEEE